MTNRVDDLETTKQGPEQRQCIAFEGVRRIASGGLAQVSAAVKMELGRNDWASILIFDATTSEPVELDLRGTAADVKRRYSAIIEHQCSDISPEEETSKAVRGPGRPKLGVVAREVTLLPRHWDWLGGQPGGASVALRKLVEQARRAGAEKDQARVARDAAYRFISVMGGNLPGFEEVARALFAGDSARFDSLTRPWPKDIREHARNLAATSFEAGDRQNRPV